MWAGEPRRAPPAPRPCVLNTSATTYTLPLYCLAGVPSLVQLEQELEQLAKAVLALAPREARPVQHAGQGPAGAGEEGEGDIVLELCTPRVPAPPAAASSAFQVGFLLVLLHVCLQLLCVPS